MLSSVKDSMDEAAAPAPAPAKPPTPAPVKPPASVPVKPPTAPPVAARAATPAAPQPAVPVAGKPAAPPGAPPPATRPPVPKTAPPRPATGPPAPTIKAEDPGKFLAALREKNFFERLGFAKSDAAPAQLKNVYFQYAKIYHPDMLPADASPQRRKQQEDILALLNEAYAVLADDARRKEYLEQLAAEAEGLAAVDIEAILRAEEDFQRAIVLIKGHKVREGLAMIEACIKLNEKEGEFYAWRGYARFLLATDKKAAFMTSMNDVQKCLKIVSRCPPAHLIEATMAKLIGDDETAKKAFKKVIELDPNNVEATRELRLYQQRAKK
jgi:tetratricopeptide (TPR) repeat protein